jgi:hypothetical protein
MRLQRVRAERRAPAGGGAKVMDPHESASLPLPRPFPEPALWACLRCPGGTLEYWTGTTTTAGGSFANGTGVHGPRYEGPTYQ